MKKLLLCLCILFSSWTATSQSCEELIEFVKNDSYGTTYSSPLSDAISKVTFYTTRIDYETYYFAIVCFKSKYSYGCTEYIYQVGYNTKFNYSMNYMDSAGEAFWEYIQPYHKNLKCSPDFG